jgi:hypothetical protein
VVIVGNDGGLTAFFLSSGQPWSGSSDEKNAFGTFDPKEQWGGWRQLEAASHPSEPPLVVGRRLRLMEISSAEAGFVIPEDESGIRE